MTTAMKAMEMTSVATRYQVLGLHPRWAIRGCWNGGAR